MTDKNKIPDWLDGSYEDALYFAAERAIISRKLGGITKKADLNSILGSLGTRLSGAKDYLTNQAGNLSQRLGLNKLLENPYYKEMTPYLLPTLAGAGVGALGGGASGLLRGRNKKRVLLDALMGAGLGGAIGGGGSLLYNRLLHPYANLLKPGKMPGKQQLSEEEKIKLINKATAARKELGLLGVSGKGLDDLVSKTTKGEISPEESQQQFKKLVPPQGITGPLTGAAQAFGQNQYGQALAQADVIGLKNLADPTTAGLAALTGTTAALGQEAALRAPGFIGRKLDQRALNSKLLGPIYGPSSGREEKIINRMISDPALASKDNLIAKSMLPGELQTLNYSRASRAFDSATGELLAAPSGPKGKKGGPSPIPISRQRLRDLAKLYLKEQPTIPSHIGWKSRMILPAFASMIPLAMKEWGPHSYRSGEKPYQDLLEANRSLYGENRAD